MTEPTPITLDRARRIRWDLRAESRLGSLDRPPAYRELASRNPRRALYALCAHVWAALVAADAEDFSSFEDVAAQLEKKEVQVAAFEALIAALRLAGVLADEKKTPEPSAVPPPSSVGPSISSNAAPAAPPPPS
jgi:hypothetical protein